MKFDNLQFAEYREKKHSYTSLHVFSYSKYIKQKHTKKGLRYMEFRDSPEKLFVKIKHG